MAVLLSFFRHRHTVETGQKSSVMLEEGLAAARSGFEKAFEQLRKLSGILRKKEEV
jgi:hypothetical protein